jgi:RHS repeat-associated protein
MQLALTAAHAIAFNPLARSGSTREMTNSSGVIQQQLAYDLFGQATQVQGSLASDFQYASYYLHSPSGLSLTLSRAYSPKLARWINRDPFAEVGSVNLYEYTKNDPVNGTDPSGLCPCPAGGENCGGLRGNDKPNNCYNCGKDLKGICFNSPEGGIYVYDAGIPLFADCTWNYNPPMKRR